MNFYLCKNQNMYNHVTKITSKLYMSSIHTYFKIIYKKKCQKSYNKNLCKISIDTYFQILINNFCYFYLFIVFLVVVVSNICVLNLI